MYRQICNFAPNIENEYSRDPLLYCVLDTMDSQFLHGAPGRTFGKYSDHCNQLLSDRCAKRWDELCEVISKDKTTNYPNTGGPVMGYEYTCRNTPCLPYGEQILRNTAFKKYRVSMTGCNVRCEPFDPTVVNSPMICYDTRTQCTSGPNGAEVCVGDALDGGTCVNTYSLTKEQIQDLDQDPVMNKILNKPEIASDLLEKIYLNMKQNNTLRLLKGTRLARFYEYLGHSI
jgi:hypothetical protein